MLGGKSVYRKYLSCLLLTIAVTGCATDVKTVKVSEEMDTVISNYILDHNKAGYAPTEQQFEAHKIYGARDVNGIIEVYLYSLFSGFNSNTKDVAQAGGSFPVLIKIKKHDDSFTVVEYKEPDDGAMYETSIKNMFPGNFEKPAINDTGNVKDLEKEIGKQVDEWLNNKQP